MLHPRLSTRSVLKIDATESLELSISSSMRTALSREPSPHMALPASFSISGSMVNSN
jgi:hypothetical protein